jgi:hypothetical protein
MNPNALAKHYPQLTPKERFRLILAASGRGDEAERDRLENAGGSITLTTQDHAPYARAFDELALLVFIELLEDAARFLEWMDRADPLPDDDGEEFAEESDAEGGEAAEDRRGKPAWERRLNLAYAAGFVLRTKAEGWKLFCERMAVPHLLLWEEFPGFDRVRRALDLAGLASFAPEDFLRWMNAVRPTGKKVLVEKPLTVEGVADETEKMFRSRVEWWGG